MLCKFVRIICIIHWCMPFKCLCFTCIAHIPLIVGILWPFLVLTIILYITITIAVRRFILYVNLNFICYFHDMLTLLLNVFCYIVSLNFFLWIFSCLYFTLYNYCLVFVLVGLHRQCLRSCAFISAILFSIGSQNGSRNFIVSYVRRGGKVLLIPVTLF